MLLSATKQKGRSFKKKTKKLVLEDVPYFSLPPVSVPCKYDKKRISKKEQTNASNIKDDLFRISFGDWRITSIEKLNKCERPNIYFSQRTILRDGLLEFTPKRNLVRFRSRDGFASPIYSLTHDIYKISSHPLGNYFAVLSSDAKLFVYNSRMEKIFEKNLVPLAEKSAAFGKPKNFVRNVLVSLDGTNILFTVVDKAWCLDFRGDVVWSVQMPPAPGFQRHIEKRSSKGATEDVMRALEVLGLSQSYSPGDVRENYRTLAKKYHPDLNPNEIDAEEKMKCINAAYKLLTGLDPRSAWDTEEEVEMYYKPLGTFEVNGLFLTLMGQDWIYAANFDEYGQIAYLGAYSGRIVAVDGNGKPLRVVDIHTTPTKIISLNDWLYILTYGGLYGLRDSKLINLIENINIRDFIFTGRGFGIIGAKCFRRYYPDGRLAGEILTKDPIREIYPSGEDLILKTRKHKCVIQGAPRWFCPSESVPEKYWQEGEKKKREINRFKAHIQSKIKDCEIDYENKVQECIASYENKKREYVIEHKKGIERLLERRKECGLLTKFKIRLKLKHLESEFRENYSQYCRQLEAEKSEYIKKLDDNKNRCIQEFEKELNQKIRRYKAWLTSVVHRLEEQYDTKTWMNIYKKV